MKYRIKYYFDGEGVEIIKARSKKEAIEKWYNAGEDVINTDEWGENSP